MLLWRLPALAIALLTGTVTAPTGALPAACLCAAAFACAPLSVFWRTVCIAALAVGVLDAAIGDRNAVYEGPSRFVTLDGAVVDVDERVEFGSRFTLRSDGKAYTVVSHSPAPPLGTYARVHGRLDAFDEPRNPGEPSPRALAAERGLYARLTHASFSVLKNRCDSVELTFARMRVWASSAVRSRIAEPSATILAGALWGERGALPDDVRADFQATGTMHVLVTAGLHVGIVAALCLFVLRTAGAGRIAGALLTIPAIWFYAALSGAHLPSLRAATMASFILAAHACGRRSFSWNALAAAAIAIALIWPASVATVSFALSFSCVAAIVIFAHPIGEALRNARVPAFLAEAIALTISTQIGTWPLTASTFLIVAPYAPFANAAVVPLTSAALVGGIALLACAPFAHAADVVAGPEGAVLGAIAWIAHAVAGLPGARAALAPPPLPLIALYDGLALLSGLLIARKRYVTAAIVLVAASLGILLHPQTAGGRLLVTVLDVGQGDAIVVRTPGGRTILVDAGGHLERGTATAASSAAERVGERTVVPFLQRQGVTRVAALILTHPHGDHVGGCAPILRSLTTDEVIDSGQPYGGFAYRDCLATAAAQHVPIVPPPVGRTLTIDGVAFSFLAPGRPYLRNTGDDVNENSIVILLSYQGRRMLLMGDAGQDTEAELLTRGISLQAGILKVGHHGSAYASTPPFLGAVRAAAAVISVGRDNTFGHPAPQTLERLHHAGAHIFRTDLCGAVTIVDLRDVRSTLGCEQNPTRPPPD